MRVTPDSLRVLADIPECVEVIVGERVPWPLCDLPEVQRSRYCGVTLVYRCPCCGLERLEPGSSLVELPEGELGRIRQRLISGWVFLSGPCPRCSVAGGRQ